MINDQLIGRVADYMKERLPSDMAGHDWYHTYRVWKLGWRIGCEEEADLYVVELASLLHDIADYKFHGGDEALGPKLAEELLQKFNVESGVISQVKEIVSVISFKGANAENKVKTLEGMCVQDADRLDAIGAVGVARAFAFAGAKGNPIYDPDIPPNVDQSEDEYKKTDHSAINHFYEKLLLIKDRLNTKAARRMAEIRHYYMEQFLGQFLKEWNLEI